MLSRIGPLGCLSNSYSAVLAMNCFWVVRLMCLKVRKLSYTNVALSTTVIRLCFEVISLKTSHTVLCLSVSYIVRIGLWSVCLSLCMCLFATEICYILRCSSGYLGTICTCFTTPDVPPTTNRRNVAWSMHSWLSGSHTWLPRDVTWHSLTEMSGTLVRGRMTLTMLI